MEVVVDYKGNMGFNAVCGEHAIAIDLPEADGGKNKAANPPQLFLASLASCVGVYVAKYCENAGIDTNGMKIGISAEKAQNPARLADIKINVDLPNAELGKRRNAVMAVAKKCLIHSTIESAPEVAIELTDKE